MVVSVTKFQLRKFHRNIIAQRGEIILHSASGKIDVVLGRYGDTLYRQLISCRTVDHDVRQEKAILLTKSYLVRRIAEYEPIFFLGCKCRLLKKQGIKSYRFLQGELVLFEK